MNTVLDGSPFYTLFVKTLRRKNLFAAEEKRGKNSITFGN